MTDKNKPQDDLSIEEILGSIRRIIAEDEPAEKEADSAPAEEAISFDAPQTAVEEEEPLELTNKIDNDGNIVDTSEEIDMISLETPEEVPQPKPAPVEDTISFDEKIILMEEPVPMAPPIEDIAPTDQLLSSTTAEATTAVMAKLARHTAALEEGNASTGQTVEAIVRDMLRPMLREWLDSNLPDMVQKMVEREIERLTKNL